MIARRLIHGLLAVGSVLLTWSVAEVLAQAPDRLPKPHPFPPGCAEPATGATPGLAPLPVRGPLPASEVNAFVEKLTNNDSTFEVTVGQGKMLTLRKDLAAAGKARPVIAVGDPAVIDFVVVGPRQLRIIGQRMGITDLSITTADGDVVSFEVRVVADLPVLTSQLKAAFPDALIKLSMVRDHVVVEGQARDSMQVARIIDTLRAYLVSLQASQIGKATGSSVTSVGAGPQAAPQPPARTEGEAAPMPLPVPVGYIYPEQRGIIVGQGGLAEPRIINLLRVPGVQQVLLKVRVAELNRTALREIGADWIGADKGSGSIFGTQIAGGTVTGTGNFLDGILSGTAQGVTNSTTTAFGVFDGANFEILIRALRRNTLLKILAEPNLVTLNGYQASFLAGGEFPVPVPQVSSGGFASTITIMFKEFGVRLNFTPYILDGEMIRLTVTPEVSTIDFALGTTLVPGGSPVPGLDVRRSTATVEMRQGQTLAMAGLMQVQLDGSTSRIPVLGDLPVIGALFSNATHQRQEKELVVTVTPYLVEPMNPGEVPPLPGDEVGSPTDLEFYLLRRIEGRIGVDNRATLGWDDPLHLRQHMKLEKKYINGPCGFSN